METKEDLQRQRMCYIDVLKGVAILLVLLGHRSFHTGITQLIYLFHMPLFFFLSGYLDKMQYDSFSAYAQKKAKRLLYPYLSFGVLIVIYNTAFDAIRGATVKGRLAKRMIALVYGNFIWENNSDYIGTLWFLAALFFASLFAYVLCRCMNRNPYLLVSGIVILICAGALCSYLNRQYGIRLPGCIDVAFLAAVYYSLGVFWRQYPHRQKYETVPFGIVSLAIGFILGICNLLYMKRKHYEMLRIDMLNMNYGLLPVFLVSASLISIGFFILFQKMGKVQRMRGMERLGQLSLLIMVDHIYIYQVIGIILERFHYNRWLVFFPICFVLSVVMAEMIDRYFKFLFDFHYLAGKAKRSRAPQE